LGPIVALIGLGLAGWVLFAFGMQTWLSQYYPERIGSYQKEFQSSWNYSDTPFLGYSPSKWLR